jgi:hypothetical protein
MKHITANKSARNCTLKKNSPPGPVRNGVVVFAGVVGRVHVDGCVVDEVEVGHHDAAGAVVGEAQVGVVELALKQVVVAVT